MADHNSHFTVWGFIKGFGKLLIGVLLLLQGLIGLIVMLLFVGVIVSVSNNIAGNRDKVSVSIPEDAALLFNPNGVIVEQAQEIDPFELMIEEAYGISEPMEIEVHDVVRVLRAAAEDERIQGLVLDLEDMVAPTSSASKLHYIASEIRKFKESGKKVIAIGDNYNQSQYLLAAEADEILMNDFGGVAIYGYGSYVEYFKSLLEKLKVTSHVFRVGTFKSAIEPFIRDDMSPEAKEANKAYIDVLWREYVNSVESARALPAGRIDNYVNNMPALLRDNAGDMSQTAASLGLIDEVTSRSEQAQRLIDEFGAARNDESEFNHVAFRRYLTSLDAPEDDADPNIAVITASGVIVDGEAPLGQNAGGDTISGLLRKARKDDDVKAVVLRVDSPGGSAFASDIIRDEILAMKKAGKPVVVSMGSLAASGGYWISADADEIWAAPTTITGSIGIFGYFATFENSAAEIGVYVDGVGTTALSPIMAAGLGPLPEIATDVIQQSIENGYDRFLSVVGGGRELSTDYVDSVGQGRVWIGERAIELRLVDKLGGLDDAIAAAAARAELEEYDVVDLVESRTPFELILSNLSVRVMSAIGAPGHSSGAGSSGLGRVIGEAEKRIEFFEQFNDPNAAYARCLACE